MKIIENHVEMVCFSLTQSAGVRLRAGSSEVLRFCTLWYGFLPFFQVVFIALSGQFGSFPKRKMLMNRILVRALELILCRLRVMLQGYLFMDPACLQEPPQTHLKPIL